MMNAIRFRAPPAVTPLTTPSLQAARKAVKPPGSRTRAISLTRYISVRVVSNQDRPGRMTSPEISRRTPAPTRPLVDVACGEARPAALSHATGTVLQPGSAGPPVSTPLEFQRSCQVRP